jgi:hypothetical protein
MNTNQTDLKLKELTETTSVDTKACQDAMEANLEKMEPNPGEKEAAVDRQETSKEEVARARAQGAKMLRSCYT